MIYMNILFVLALGFVLCNFTAGIMRKEYTLTRKSSIIGLICMIYLGGYGILLHLQIAFFSYGAKETIQDFMQFICEAM